VFLQGSIFNAIQLAVLRFYPAAGIECLTKTLMGEVSTLFYKVTLAIAVLYGAALWFRPSRYFSGCWSQLCHWP
jgi:hypothetical protein